ncbi:MAG: hypothetical protein ACD_16C00200G0003 [uncultured bacterium]|nr:MAG: hypothetical protein ACD_16C00200G0003 [uncultured bacterium]
MEIKAQDLKGSFFLNTCRRCWLGYVIGCLDFRSTFKRTQRIPEEEMDLSSNELTSGLSVEEEERLKEQFFDRHYREWLDSPLPALKGKTPRDAVKTKTSFQHVIDLVKDMGNAEQRAVKQGNQSKPYNFDWLFAELGIDLNLL